MYQRTTASLPATVTATWVCRELALRRRPVRSWCWSPRLDQPARPVRRELLPGAGAARGGLPTAAEDGAAAAAAAEAAVVAGGVGGSLAAAAAVAADAADGGADGAGCGVVARGSSVG